MINYKDTSSSYKAVLVLVFIIAPLATILNGIAIAFLACKRKRPFKPDQLILFSLCLVNLLFGATVTFDFSMFVCHIDALISAYFIMFSMIASLIHVLVLTGERFVCVRFPFKHKNMKRRTVYFVIAVTWIFSVFPPFLVNKIGLVTYLMIFLVLSIITDAALIITYVYMFYSMTRSLKNSRSMSELNNIENRKDRKDMERKITVFCCTIVASNLVCSLPPIITFLYKKGTYMSPFSGDVIDLVIFIFMICKAVFDPMVYILRNKLFRITDRICWKTKKSVDFQSDIHSHFISTPDLKQKIVVISVEKKNSK